MEQIYKENTAQKYIYSQATYISLATKCLLNLPHSYVSQITVRYIVFHRVLVFLATPMCYIPFERVFDVD